MPDVPELLKDIQRLRKTLRGFVTGKSGRGAMRERMGKRHEIEARIGNHFKNHPAIPDKDRLFKLLSLE